MVNPYVGVTFPNGLWAHGVKSAQGTIKLRVKSDFSSELTPFLAIIGGGGGAGPPKEM